MNDEELVSVYSVKSPSQAEIIRNALESEGIFCRLDGDGQAGLAGIMDIDVLVAGADAERARAILEMHEPLADGSDVEADELDPGELELGDDDL